MKFLIMNLLTVFNLCITVNVYRMVYANHKRTDDGKNIVMKIVDTKTGTTNEFIIINPYKEK